jgi:hypothetical protein
VFQQLDSALAALLADAAMPAALQELRGAQTSFLTPEKGYPIDSDTVNLFLYETKENRELREPLPVKQTLGGISARRRPPLRVDCSYMVTTWSTQCGVDKITAEHLLLGQAFNWLSRFPRLPLEFFPTAARSGQVFEPPTLVAQMDGAKSAGEFWHALGIPPRPYFNVMVTVAMDLDTKVEDALVTSLTTDILMLGTDAREARVLIGGTVRGGPDRLPVANAWVRLDPRGETAVSDSRGRFVFEQAPRDRLLTLRARALGFDHEAVLQNFVVPSPTGAYDLMFR